ncbi:MAG: transglycosylase SLT domain-containing protein, partial [Flavobacteriales bacterium]
MKKLLSFIWVILLTPCLVFSQEKNNGKNSSKENKADSVILKDDNPRISAMDSLLKLKVFKKDSFITDTSKLNVYNYPADSIPTFEDSVYKKRVHELNKKSPIELQYNDKVKAFIKLYANKKRNLTSRFLGLSEVYFPMIEEKLDKFGIPLEMKYLAIVESALNPTAHSRAGAKGLWQFMYRTGKLYDLNVTSYVDERMSHEKATIAACKYLKFLHGIYDDWNLVMAAYNAGPGRVNRAMRRAGGKMGYWELRPHLPRETRGYVPAFIAVNYIMNYSAEHNLYPIQPDMRYFEFDTIHVKEPVTFKGLHELMNIPYKTLEFLNPKYKRGKIPEGNKILRLPKDQIGTFLANEDSIYEYEPKPDIVNGFIVKQKAEYHRVRSGENLGVIANKYNCSVRQIMQWNNKRSTRIHPGQRIKIQRTVKIPVDDKEKVADKRNTDSLQKIKPKPPALGEDIIETSSHELVAVVDSNKLKNKIEEI